MCTSHTQTKPTAFHHKTDSYIREETYGCFGPLTTVPSASVEETKVKSPLVGENCMADSDNSSGFTHNHTHCRRSHTFTPLPRLTIPTDQLSDGTAGSKQSWRKQEVQKNTDDTSNPGAERNGEGRAPPSARTEHWQHTFNVPRQTTPWPFWRKGLHVWYEMTFII